MQNRFKIVFRTEKNRVKIALHCKKLLQLNKRKYVSNRYKIDGKLPPNSFNIV